MKTLKSINALLLILVIGIFHLNAQNTPTNEASHKLKLNYLNIGLGPGLLLYKGTNSILDPSNNISINVTMSEKKIIYSINFLNGFNNSNNRDTLYSDYRFNYYQLGFNVGRAFSNKKQTFVFEISSGLAFNYINSKNTDENNDVFNIGIPLHLKTLFYFSPKIGIGLDYLLYLGFIGGSRNESYNTNLSFTIQYRFNKIDK